jgi:G3E family GTPase
MNGADHFLAMPNGIDREEDDDEVPTLQNLDEAPPPPSCIDDVEELLLPTPPDSAVPVTILTGFLGSGKSSLVRHVLTSPRHGRRIAVIENEYGGGDDYCGASLAERMGLSVETVIVRDGTSTNASNGGNLLADLIELPNGCVCCTVKDSLVLTLERLLERRSDLDYVLIEASGMADPGPVASIFWLDGALDSRLRLDGIICCVDARNVEYQLEFTSSSSSSSSSSWTGSEDGRGGGDEAARQIAFADRIILNKVDLLRRRTSSPPDDRREDPTVAIEDVMRRLEGINPTAPILVTAYSRVDDLDWILDARCFDAARARDVESAFARIARVCGDDDDVGTTASPARRDVGGSCGNAFCIGRHPPTNDDADPYVCGLCSNADESSSSSASRGRHRHTDAVGTIALYGIGSVDMHRINSWLASILWPNQDESDKVLRARLEGGDNPPSTTIPSSCPSRENEVKSNVVRQRIYRVKGVLSVRHAVDDTTGNVTASSNDYVDEGLVAGIVDPNDGSDGRRYIVQAVNDLWDVLPASDDLRWDDTVDARCCKVIVIGKWLDETILRDGFDDCFVSPSASGRGRDDV